MTPVEEQEWISQALLAASKLECRAADVARGIRGMLTATNETDAADQVVKFAVAVKELREADSTIRVLFRDLLNDLEKS